MKDESADEKRSVDTIKAFNALARTLEASARAHRALFRVQVALTLVCLVTAGFSLWSIL